jgi:hypothetical protein
LGFRKVYVNFKGNERWSPSGLSSWSSFVSAIYINDNPINIQKGRTTLFDDTNTQRSQMKELKEVMQQLSSWFYLNKLVINTDKTIAISFHAW